MTAQNVADALLKQYGVEVPAIAVQLGAADPVAAEEGGDAAAADAPQDPKDAVTKLKTLGQHAVHITLGEPPETLTIPVIINKR